LLALVLAILAEIMAFVVPAKMAIMRKMEYALSARAHALYVVMKLSVPNAWKATSIIITYALLVSLNV
jgi:hypothetical protein